MYATIMTIVAILAIICCLVEAWFLIEAGRELDRVKEGDSREIEELMDALASANDGAVSLQETIAELEQQIAVDMGCTCHLEETCAGFPEHNMSKDEMVQEMLRQNEEDMKAEQARLAAYVCDQCGKRGGCYCNGMTSSGEVFPHPDEACRWCGSHKDGCCNGMDSGEAVPF